MVYKKRKDKKKKWKKNNQGPKKKAHYPGELIQIDIKYVPKQCIGFDSKGISYYQITAIDTFSSRRVLVLVDEKSLTHTTKFVHTLEKKIGFKIDCVQTDNGSEFTSTHPHSVEKQPSNRV